MNLARTSAARRSAPLIDPLQDRLGYQLRRASAVNMARVGGALASIGLRPSEATVLMLIEANPDCSQSDIGRSLDIKRANMVPLIAGLADAGFVDRRAADGRSQALSLTPAGQAKVKIVGDIVNAEEAVLESLLPDGSRDALIRALQGIRGPDGD